MNRPELGTKLLCDGCGVRFYDLNKRAVTCPACGELHKPRISLPSVPRRLRDRGKPTSPAPGALDPQSPAQDKTESAAPSDAAADDLVDAEFADDTPADEANEVARAT